MVVYGLGSDTKPISPQYLGGLPAVNPTIPRSGRLTKLLHYCRGESSDTTIYENEIVAALE